MKAGEGAGCQIANPFKADPPLPLDLKKGKTWKVYEWPELNEARPAIGLKIAIEKGVLFSTPGGRVAGTYAIPEGVSAWGWHAKKGTWINLMEFGGFLPKFSHVTFVPPANVAMVLTGTIFLELFPTEEQVRQAFPDNVREYPPEESIIDDLNLAPFITIRSCSEERKITLYEDGDAFVEITVPNSVPFNQVPAVLDPGKKAARDLAEARARRRLATKVTLTVANATCPDACNMPIGIPGEVSSNLTHDREESVRGDDHNMYVDWYSRHVANVTLRLKCKKIG